MAWEGTEGGVVVVFHGWVEEDDHDHRGRGLRFSNSTSSVSYTDEDGPLHTDDEDPTTSPFGKHVSLRPIVPILLTRYLNETMSSHDLGPSTYQGTLISSSSSMLIFEVGGFQWHERRGDDLSVGGPNQPPFPYFQCPLRHRDTLFGVS
ncbi:hypothetical protein HMI55_006503 [Coelomomyces lativittatus]|nr:hypothetical protein HMI55_006503 [Coelomomyces lativittatus]